MHRFEDAAHRHGRLGGQRRSEPARLGDQRLRRDDLVDQPDPPGLLGVDRRPGQQHLERAAPADQTW